MTLLNSTETDDAPRYHSGNKINIYLQAVTIVLFLFQRARYDLTNKWRSYTWNHMSDYEKKAYLDENEKKGNKRLDFRYRL